MGAWWLAGRGWARLRIAAPRRLADGPQCWTTQAVSRCHGNKAVSQVLQSAGPVIDSMPGAQLPQTLRNKPQRGSVTLDDLENFPANHQNRGRKESHVMRDVQTCVVRHRDTCKSHVASKRFRLPAIDPSVEERVINRLKAKLRGGPAPLLDLKNLLGNPHRGGGEKEIRVVADWTAFVSRHADVFSYDAETKRLSLRPLSCDITNATHAETRVIQRLTAKLFLGPVKVSSLTPDVGGGPEYPRIVTDWEVFAMRHPDLFIYDAATERLGLRTVFSDRDKVPAPGIRSEGTAAVVEAEPRVAQRLITTLQSSSPAAAIILDATTKMVPPNLPIENHAANTVSVEEARVVERLTTKLKGGPINSGGVKGFLGSPQQGGRPEDLQVIKNWEAFVERHGDTFCYDTKTTMLSLRTFADNQGIDPTAEARVVQRLKARLQGGPVLTIVLKTFLGFRRDGGRPQDVQVVKNWPAFVARHADEFDYNVVTKYLGLRARSEPSCTLVKEAKEVTDGDSIETPLKSETRKVDESKLTTQFDPAQVTSPKGVLNHSGGDVRAETVKRRADAFAYFKPSPETHTFPYLFGDQCIDRKTEADLVPQLVAALERGPIDIHHLEGILSLPKDRSKGDMALLADLLTFVTCHTDWFCYDAATKSVNLRAHIRSTPSVCVE